MKSIIYYFSATGNSYKVAKDIAQNLGDTDLVSIPKIIDINEDIDISVDTIGVVFPVYCWGLPIMVERFLSRLRKENAKYFFAVATCGGSAAGTLLQAQKLLAKRDIYLDSGFQVIMPTNYIIWSGAIPQEKQQEMFDNWKVRLDFIVDIIRSQKKSEIESGSAIANFFLSKLIYKISIPRFPKMDKSFWADDNCNNCGICHDICPSSNIKMNNGKPIWNQNCEQCLACIQWCPKESIQFGKNTKGRKRYTHPDVRVKDLIK